MAILARSSSNSQTTTATMQLQQQLPPNPLAHLSTSTLLTLISPALTNTLVFFSYLQLFLRSYALTTLVVLLSHSFKITRGLILNGLYITSHLLQSSGPLLLSLHKQTEPVRRKLFFEFMIFLLNPGLGHGLCVLLFWPGWVLVWLGLGGWWLLG